MRSSNLSHVSGEIYGSVCRMRSADAERGRSFAFVNGIPGTGPGRASAGIKELSSISFATSPAVYEERTRPGHWRIRVSVAHSFRCFDNDLACKWRKKPVLGGVVKL